MPARRHLKSRPNEYLDKEGTWPDGPLKEGAPAEAEFLMDIAQRLKDACTGKSVRSVATAADLDTQTVINILKGNTWCEVPTIYRLEKSLVTHLWPRRHVISARLKQQPQPPNP